MSRSLVTGQLPAKKYKGGRKTKFEMDPDIINRIEQALRIGTPPLTAAAFQGISYDTMREWVLKAKEHPESIYGEFIVRINKAIAEWEIRNISVLETHAHGRPATYEMEVVRDKKGEILYESPGKPLMQIAKDGDGKPIIKTTAIKPDWRPALEMLQRRMPKNWASNDKIDIDAVLTIENQEAGSKEALSFEQQVAEVNRRLEEDV